MHPVFGDGLCAVARCLLEPVLATTPLRLFEPSEDEEPDDPWKLPSQEKIESSSEMAKNSWLSGVAGPPENRES